MDTRKTEDSTSPVTAHLTGPALVKFIRKDSFDFWRWFVYSVTSNADTPSWQSQRPLRKTKQNLKAWKFHVDGVVPAVGQPLFNKKDKEGFSKPQSMTYCHIDAGLAPPIFHHGRDEVLVGVQTGMESAKITRIMRSDMGSVCRTYGQFPTKETAEKYFNEAYARKDIFKNVSELEELKNNDKYNEVMARIKWENDGSSIRIFKDNRASRLLAQLRAHDLQRRLKNNTAIPISTQFESGDEVNVFFYEEKTQQQDLTTVLSEDIKHTSGSKNSKKPEEFYLARLMLLSQHDFDRNKTKFDIPFEDMLEYTTLASHLTYETSHLFFTKVHQASTTKIELAKKLSVFQWKELFDCIHPDQCDAFFDSILKDLPDDTGKLAALSRVSAGYMACLVDRNSELFNNKIIELFKYLNGNDLNALFPANNTLFGFIALSGNLLITKKIILKYQKEIQYHIKISSGSENLEIDRYLVAYGFNSISILLSQKKKEAITEQHIAGVDLIDAIQTGNDKEAKKLITKGNFIFYYHVIDLCIANREDISLLIFICCQNPRYLDVILEYVENKKDDELAFILTFLKVYQCQYLGDRVYIGSKGYDEKISEGIAVKSVRQLYFDVMLNIKAWILNPKTNLPDSDISRLRAEADKEGRVELSYILRHFKTFKNSLTHSSVVKFENDPWKVGIRIPNSLKEQKYNVKMLSEIKWENNASSQILFTEDDIQSRLCAKLRALDLAHTLKISHKDCVLVLGDCKDKTLFIYDKMLQDMDFSAALCNFLPPYHVTHVIFLLMANFDIAATNELLRVHGAKKAFSFEKIDTLVYLKIFCYLSNEVGRAFFALLEKNRNLDSLITGFSAENFKNLFSCMPIEKATEYFSRLCKKFNSTDAKTFDEKQKPANLIPLSFSLRAPSLSPLATIESCGGSFDYMEERVNFTSICLGYTAFLIQCNSDQCFSEIEKILAQKLLTEKDIFSSQFQPLISQKNFFLSSESENLLQFTISVGNERAINILMKHFGGKLIEQALKIPTAETIELLLASAKHLLKPIDLFYLLIAANSFPALMPKLTATFPDSIAVQHIEEKFDWRKMCETKEPQPPICHFANDLKTRLLMQIRANDLKFKYKNLANTPVIFTDAKEPSSKKMFLYDEKRQEEDLNQALSVFTSDISIMIDFISYQKNNFATRIQDIYDGVLNILNAHTDNNTTDSPVKMFPEFLSIACKLSYAMSHTFFTNLIFPNLNKIAEQLKASQWQSLFDCINPTERMSYFTTIKAQHPHLVAQISSGFRAGQGRMFSKPVSSLPPLSSSTAPPVQAKPNSA